MTKNALKELSGETDHLRRAIKGKKIAVRENVNKILKKQER